MGLSSKVNRLIYDRVLINEYLHHMMHSYVLENSYTARLILFIRMNTIKTPFFYSPFI